MQTITSASHVISALAQYAQILDAASFDAAIDVYTAWGKTVDSQDRLLLCQAMNDAIRSRQGQGFEALLPFILVDPDPQVVANAALKAAVLFPARHRDPLEGARFVVRLTKVREHPKRSGAILGGLMLLGDERLTPRIHETWDCLPYRSCDSGDPEAYRDFTRVSSEFYPELSKHYERLFDRWTQAYRRTDEESDA